MYEREASFQLGSQDADNDILNKYQWVQIGYTDYVIINYKVPYVRDLCLDLIHGVIVIVKQQKHSCAIFKCQI